jgi:hypothetical protein
MPSGATSIGALEQQFGGKFAKMASKQAIDQAMQAAGPAARAIVYGERAGGLICWVHGLPIVENELTGRTI